MSFPGTMMSKGQPDIFCCYHGQMYCFEVKSPKAPKETPLQAAMLKKWKEAGAVALVVRTTAELDRLLNRQPHTHHKPNDPDIEHNQKGN